MAEDRSGAIPIEQTDLVFTYLSREGCRDACLRDDECNYAAYDLKPTEHKCFLWYESNATLGHGAMSFILYTKSFTVVQGEDTSNRVVVQIYRVGKTDGT